MSENKEQRDIIPQPITKQTRREILNWENKLKNHVKTIEKLQKYRLEREELYFSPVSEELRFILTTSPLSSEYSDNHQKLKDKLEYGTYKPYLLLLRNEVSNLEKVKDDYKQAISTMGDLITVIKLKAEAELERELEEAKKQKLREIAKGIKND